MRNRICRRLLAATVSLTALGAAGGAIAQDQTPPPDQATEVDEIIVTGIRAALQESVEVKRDADNIVDVITAEDIGKLPDENIAESIQRVPGVQLTRDGGEGKGVNIRGLTAQTLINGRVVLGNFAEGQSARDFDFRNLAADFVQTIEVSKSPTADQPEGTLGGNINLITRRPLDLRGPVLSFAGEAQYSDYAENWDPTVSAFAADQWADGTVGGSISLNYGRRRLRTDSFRTQSGWAPLNLGRNTGFDFNADGVANDVLRPADLRFLAAEDERTRYGVDATLQFKPTDALDIRFDGNYSRFENIHRENFFRTLSTNLTTFDPGSLRISSAGSLLGARYNNQLVEVDGRYEPEVQNTYAFGGNVRWRGERLTLEADVSYTKSDRQRTSHFLRFESLTPATVAYDFTSNDAPPNVVVTTAAGAPFDFLTPSGYRPNLTFDRIINFSQTEKAARFDATYDFDEGSFFSSVRAGVRATVREVPYRTVASANQATNTANRAFFDAPGRRFNVGEAPLSQFTGTFPFSDGVLSGFGGSFPRRWLVGVYPEGDAEDGSLAFVEALNIRSFGGLLNSNAEQSDIDEDTVAGYVAADFGGDFGAMSFEGNVGLRYAETQLTSAGLLTTPAGIRPISLSSTYDNWLPAANLKLNITNQLVLRLAAARVIERPDLRQLATGFTLDTSAGTARAGNPALEPYLADQFDVSLEYYMGEGGLVSVAAFRKDVENFITSVTAIGQIPGVVRLNGSPDFLIARPVNGGGGKLEGFEVSLQQGFTFLPAPFDGFGAILNYTYTKADTDSGTPFPRLSRDNLNLIGYYENGPLSSRIAYSYRSRFASFGIGGNAAQQSGQSEFTADTGYLDASISYEISDKITVVLEGANLLDTAEIRYLGEEERVRDIAVNDRRFTAGIRLVF